MSSVRTHLRRYGLALLGAAALAGCSSGGTDENEGSITLALNPTSATVQQGNQTTVNATLTRLDGFTGTVNLTVTGAPTGVTATVGNVVTTGTTTTATVTVTVVSTTTPGVYTLVVHGTGTGVAEATVNFTLTVTAAPTPAVALTLSAAALTIVQGAATPTTTVNIGRTNFPGNVTLSVENLPTGVTASFAPANPQTSISSVLTLTVAGNAPTGTFGNLVVRATGTGITDATTPLSLTIAAAAPSFSLSLSQATLSIAQGASTPTTTVNIARINFTGDVALSVLNLPTGVTASFAPANPQTGSTSVLTLTVAPGAPTGVFTNLQVQGVGSTGTVTTPLSLTITAGTPAGNFTLSTTPPTSVSLVQGASAQVTVNINRTGGNTSSIDLTTTGTLPAGMTLALPSPTTTNSSTLTITTTVATPVGSYPIVIHGNTAGLGEQLANLTINVTAPGGSGNVTVSFATCPAISKAVWLAFMDGTSGTWTAVTGAADVYNFNITQSKGSFAYVTLNSPNSTIIVQHMTQAELTAGPFNFCPTATIPNTRIANGTYSNLPAGFLAQFSFGGGSGIATGAAAGSFQITNAMNTGAFDLVAFAKLVGGAGGERAFIKRGENPAPAGNFSVDVNFTGPNSDAAASATATLNGLTGSETSGVANVNFYTGGSACILANLYTLIAVPPTSTLYGVPASLRNPATDMHNLNIFVANGPSSFRTLIENFLDPVVRAATPFVLPLELPVPVATDLGGPYKRPQVVVTGVPAEFNLSHTMTYNDVSVSGKSGVVSATQGWVGGPNLTLNLPNFSGVGTFNNAWAPGSADQLNWGVISAGGTFTSLCAAGQRSVSAIRTGTL
jgi:hypothetical protein